MPGTWLKDDPELQTTPLAPAVPIEVKGEQNDYAHSIAKTYNRLGGLMAALAAKINVGTVDVLTVWLGDARREPHRTGRTRVHFCVELFPFPPAKRLELGHHFYDSSGKPKSFAQSQDLEYEALELAVGLNREPAFRATRIGAPQLKLHLFKSFGYPSAEAMYHACQADERWQVLGLFDLSKDGAGPDGQLFDLLRTHNWREFARFHRATDYISYGGDWEADRMGARYADLYERVAAILNAR